MKCPRCGSTLTEVKDSRPRDGGCQYKRRHCLDCHHRFPTLEVAGFKDVHDLEALRERDSAFQSLSDEDRKLFTALLARLAHHPTDEVREPPPELIDDDDTERETDPENIYGLASIQQSIEEDRP